MAEAENKGQDLEKNPGGEGTAENKSQTELNAGDSGGAGAGEGGEPDFSKYEPEVRKTLPDYIQERREHSRAPAPSESGGGVGEGGGEYELEDKAQAVLQREVERQVRERLKPYEEVVVKTANENEVSSFLANPEHSHYARFNAVARKIMDAYKGITAENAFILAEAKFGNPEARGAEAERKRAKEAQRARGGSSPRPASRAGAGEVGAEDIESMTPEQFAAFNERIKGGAKVKTT